MNIPKIFTETEKDFVRNKIINNARLKRELLQEKLKAEQIKIESSKKLDMNFILEMLDDNFKKD